MEEGRVFKPQLERSREVGEGGEGVLGEKVEVWSSRISPPKKGG